MHDTPGLKLDCLGEIKLLSLKIWLVHWILVFRKFCQKLVKVKRDDNFLNTACHLSCKLELN